MASRLCSVLTLLEPEALLLLCSCSTLQKQAHNSLSREELYRGGIFPAACRQQREALDRASTSFAAAGTEVAEVQYHSNALRVILTEDKNDILSSKCNKISEEHLSKREYLFFHVLQFIASSRRITGLKLNKTYQ